MKGFPKTIQTKQDVMNLLGDYPERTKTFLQSILDGRFSWVTTGTLDTAEQGIEDETHRVLELNDEEAQSATILQQEWQVRPNAKLFRMGFTPEEVEGLLS